MKTRFVVSLIFAFLFSSFFSFAMSAFAEEDTKTIIFGKPQIITNVRICKDEGEALYIAKIEVEFFMAKKSKDAFKKEIGKYILACGVVGEGLFIPLKSIYEYVGYDGENGEPLKWSIVEAATEAHSGGTFFLFIRTSLLFTY
ncbi:MAG: hypothetical protein HYT28_01200 [Parcubacteria group bacterium]|nr:hypothetical protein [Parcubacteria group bacterium]